MRTLLLSTAQRTRLQHRYQSLTKQLGDLSWISQGSVMNDRASAWRWTRKLNAKTVTVALSPAQAALYQKAIAEHRKLEAILREMRQLSQRVLLPPKRARAEANPPPIPSYRKLAQRHSGQATFRDRTHLKKEVKPEVRVQILTGARICRTPPSDHPTVRTSIDWRRVFTRRQSGSIFWSCWRS